jgi:hypothetical protein
LGNLQEKMGTAGAEMGTSMEDGCSNGGGGWWNQDFRW